MHTQRQDARWGVQRCRHARLACHTVKKDAARGVARRRRVWLGCSGGSGERLIAGGVA
jgi:hypothetical protein